MKILGVDYGSKRVGLATIDTEVAMAFPLRSIPSGRAEELAGAIAAAAAAESAGRIIVGLPIRMSGSGGPGDTERAVVELVAALRTKTTAEVDTEDERLTTALVERERREAGLDKKQFDKDAAAAAALLETYVARQAPGSFSDLISDR